MPANYSVQLEYVGALEQPPLGPWALPDAADPALVAWAQSMSLSPTVIRVWLYMQPLWPDRPPWYPSVLPWPPPVELRGRTRRYERGREIVG